MFCIVYHLMILVPFIILYQNILFIVERRTMTCNTSFIYSMGTLDTCPIDNHTTFPYFDTPKSWCSINLQLIHHGSNTMCTVWLCFYSATEHCKTFIFIINCTWTFLGTVWSPSQSNLLNHLWEKLEALKSMCYSSAS